MSNDAARASCWRLYAAISTSLETLTACSGHPVTHSRHWMHAAYDNESVFLPSAGVEVWIAPVGHDRAHSSHAVQRLKSMTGNPNDGRTPNGSASVSTPVFRLFAMIRSILAVVSGIREIEAFVDHREVRDDVARHRENQPRPVQKTRVGDLDTSDLAPFVGRDPMCARPAPRFYPPEGR